MSKEVSTTAGQHATSSPDALHPKKSHPGYGRLLSIRTAALYLEVSESTIKNYIHEGQLKTYRLPHPEHRGEFLERVLIERVELDRLADEGIRL